MLDRNKTALTHRITAVACAYLDAAGFKPVETEVPVAAGWVADVASYIYPTKTEAKKLQLTEHAEAWLGKPDPVYLIGDGPVTALCEVKVSRSDFKADRKFKQQVAPANLTFVAFPNGLLTRDEIPWGWYGFETDKSGQRLRKVHRLRSRFRGIPFGQILDVVAAVGIRRDHRTRHRALRDWSQMYRAVETNSQRQCKGTEIVAAIAAWLQGTGYDSDRSIREMLEDRGLSVPKNLLPSLDYLSDLRERTKGAVGSG